jgi:hypothetical protein
LARLLGPKVGQHGRVQFSVQRGQGPPLALAGRDNDRLQPLVDESFLMVSAVVAGGGHGAFSG